MPLLGFFGMLGLCRGRQRYQACHTRRGEARTSCRLESVMSTRDRVTVGQDRKRSSRASCSLCWLVVVVTFAMLEDWDFIPAKKNGIEKVLHSATGYSRTHSFIHSLIHSFIRLDSALRESRRAVAGTFLTPIIAGGGNCSVWEFVSTYALLRSKNSLKFELDI